MPRLLLPAALATIVLTLLTAGLSARRPAHVVAHVAVPAPAEAAQTAPPSGPVLTEAAAPNPANRIDVEGGSLDLSVGVYGDCTRATEVGHDGAYIDACIPRPLAYFIGHNPGPFTPMADVPVGQVVDYYDGSGTQHRLQVIAARDWNRFWGPPPLARDDVVAQFQTCITLDATWDRILDAVEIPNPPPPTVVPALGEYRSQNSI